MLVPFVNRTTTIETYKMAAGFSYGATTTYVLLSIAVITSYCLVTIAYVLYILVSGSVSTAWNSAIELVACALQSKRPGHLGHTSVGINSLEAMRQNVGIRVNAEEELELVFANDRGTGFQTCARLREIRYTEMY